MPWALGWLLEPSGKCVRLVVGSWRTPSLIWWASWPLEVASGGRCPWAVGFCQGAGWGPHWVLSGGGGGEVEWGGTGLLVGASPWWYPPTFFCYSCPHPEGSSVGGTWDAGEVTEVSCWTGQSLLALKAPGGSQDQAQRSGVAGAVQGTAQVSLWESLSWEDPEPF